MSMGQLWGALAPQGYNLYPNEDYVLAQLDSLFKCCDSQVSTKFLLCRSKGWHLWGKVSWAHQGCIYLLKNIEYYFTK